MGDSPTTVNQPAKTVEDLIHAAIYDLALEAAMKAMRADMPWLNWPIISPLFTLLMRKLASYLYIPLAESGAIAVIKLQTDQEKKDYANAEAALRLAHLSGNIQAMDQAAAAFKTALRRLVHWDGSAPL